MLLWNIDFLPSSGGDSIPAGTKSGETDLSNWSIRNRTNLAAPHCVQMLRPWMLLAGMK